MFKVRNSSWANSQYSTSYSLNKFHIAYRPTGICELGSEIKQMHVYFEIMLPKDLRLPSKIQKPLGVLSL